MASLNSRIDVKFEFRPCYVKGVKALFHRWIHKSEIVPPSVYVGGHNGGVVSGTLAIVEYEDGRIGEARPTDIRFIDRKFDDYCFEDERHLKEE